MSTAEASNKKRMSEPRIANSDHLDLDLDLDLDLSKQSFAKSLSKSSKECENCLKTEAVKFQAFYENHSYSKIAKLEESLKKKKQEDRTFSVLRKTLGSFLDNGSDEDIPGDD